MYILGTREKTRCQTGLGGAKWIQKSQNKSRSSWLRGTQGRLRGCQSPPSPRASLSRKKVPGTEGVQNAIDPQTAKSKARHGKTLRPPLLLRLGSGLCVSFLSGKTLCLGKSPWKWCVCVCLFLRKTIFLGKSPLD